MLDIGATYTRCWSWWLQWVYRIRCNAEVGGCSGYAELKAASSHDMLPNLSTTRTDGGWMCSKSSNDDYMQLPGSDNKVNFITKTQQ